MKIPLRAGNATTAVYARRKMRTEDKDNFCKRGADRDAVLLVIARVSQLKVVVVILGITEEWQNTHTRKNSILWELCVLYPHTGKSRKFRGFFSLKDSLENINI